MGVSHEVNIIIFSDDVSATLTTPSEIFRACSFKMIPKHPLQLVFHKHAFSERFRCRRRKKKKKEVRDLSGLINTQEERDVCD